MIEADDREIGATEERAEIRVVRQAGEAVTPELVACLEALDPGAPADYRALAAALAQSWRTG